MDEFKDQIKGLYKAFSDNQKNTKGTHINLIRKEILEVS